MNIAWYFKSNLLIIAALFLLVAACGSDDDMGMEIPKPEIVDLSFANNFNAQFDSSYYQYPEEILLFANSITSFPDGSFAYTGVNAQGITEVVKMNQHCDILWQSAYISYFSISQKLIALQDGGLLLISNISEVDYYTNEESLKISATKFTAAGELLWTEEYDYRDKNKGYDVIELADGRFLIAGDAATIEGGYSTNHDGVLILTSSTGQEIWHSFIDLGEKDYIRSIQTNGNAQFLILGYTLHSGVTNEQIFMVNIDSNGKVLWKKSISNPNPIDENLSCAKTDNGEFICATTTIPNDLNFSSDLRVFRLTAEGELVWSINYGDSTWVTGIEIVPTVNNDFFILGKYEASQSDLIVRPNLYVLKINELGENIWAQSFASSENGMYVFDMITTPENGLIIGGGARENHLSKSFLLKLDAEGFPQ